MIISVVLMRRFVPNARGRARARAGGRRGPAQVLGIFRGTYRHDPEALDFVGDTQWVQYGEDESHGKIEAKSKIVVLVYAWASSWQYRRRKGNEEGHVPSYVAPEGHLNMPFPCCFPAENSPS